MEFQGEELDGIFWEQTFLPSQGRKAIRFWDTHTGYTNFFPLVDTVYSAADNMAILDTLTLTFLSQCTAYRQSMAMVEAATKDAKARPLDSIFEGTKK
jgi:hypothetical protein